MYVSEADGEGYGFQVREHNQRIHRLTALHLSTTFYTQKERSPEIQAREPKSLLCKRTNVPPLDPILLHFGVFIDWIG